jgi:xylan 1,4-beta-xylosidase
MTIEITADAAGSGEPLAHFWSTCVGAGRANEGLRAGWQEHLRTVVDACGFRYVRFHGLFHDDMFVYQERDGQPTYNFQYVNELFDRLLDAGIRPFVELGFCPGDLARQTGTVFWWKGNGAPPLNLDRWAELVERTVVNFVDRYGIEEVRRWYFEVWNEPNLRPFFAGTRSEYFSLYEVTARTVRKVDPRLPVGGPATSNFVPDGRFAGETENLAEHAVVVRSSESELDTLDWQPVWLADFLEFCHTKGLPVDFVSCHPYPTDWALDEHGDGVHSTRGVDATRTDLARVRGIVDAGPYPDAEIHLTEWSSSPSSRDHTHDTLPAATFVVKANVESAGLVDSLSYWTFTDVFEENGAGDTSFHGGFGMINYQGIPKPTFHAYRLLNLLGDERIAQVPGAIVTRDKATGRLTVLAYHYPPEVGLSVPASVGGHEVADRTLATGATETLDVTLTGLRPSTTLLIETLDHEHGNALAAWRSMGAPEPLSRQQAAALRAAGAATDQRTVDTDESGRLRLRMPMQPWSVVLIRELE